MGSLEEGEGIEREHPELSITATALLTIS